LCHDAHDLQILVNQAVQYSITHRYKLQPQKSVVIEVNTKGKKQQDKNLPLKINLDDISAHATALIVIVPIRHPIFEFSYDLSRSSMYNLYNSALNNPPCFTPCWQSNESEIKMTCLQLKNPHILEYLDLNRTKKQKIYK
jgi:hypothetical protein